MPFESSAVLLDEPRPSTFGDPSTKVDLPGLTLNASTGRNCFRPRAYSKRGRRPIPTVILHHSALLRAGLAHILAETQFCIRAQGSSFEHLPQRALAGEQCLALVGIDQTDADAVPSEILDLKSRYPHVHVIALGEELRARALLSLIEAGADGYLLTCEVIPEALLRCFEVVVLGGVVIPRGSIRIQEEGAASRSDATDLIESACSSPSVSTSRHEPAQSVVAGVP